MPSFVHPSLIFGPLALLVGVPILIHLINLLRHRRIRWGAMEFLLASQKKHRTQVWMRQLLLLLVRIAAVAVVLLMLSGMVLTGEWARLFATGQTHHVLLVDDSFSMTADAGGGSDFDRARRAAEQIAAQIARQDEPQQVTLLTFSEAAHRSWDPEKDLVKHSVGDAESFLATLREASERLEASQLAVGPLAALEGIESLVTGANADDSQVVHVLTDFRVKDWNEAAPLRERIDAMAEAGVRLHLVRCTASAEPNLSVADLRPHRGTHAAGVPIVLTLSVANHSSMAVRNVVVAIESSRPPESAASALTWDRLPAVRIDQIAAGETAAARSVVRFATAGEHVIRAHLEGDALVGADAVAVDNTRFAALDVPLEVPVLLVDGDPKDDDALLLGTALRPGGTTRTGLNPTVEPPAALRDRALARYACIYLLNTGRLERSVVAAVEKYVSAGGGVVHFAGPNTDRSFVNAELYRDGQGFFPLPLVGPVDLAPARDAAEADWTIEKGSPLARLSGTIYQLAPARVRRYFAVEQAWQPPPNSKARVLARLRNGAPLIVEKEYGRGRAVVVLTTAGRAWTDWPAAMTFPILVQELQSLVARTAVDHSGAVGAPIIMPLDPARHASQGKVVIHTPRAPGSGAERLDRAVQSKDGNLQAVVGDTNHQETAVAGAYRLELPRKDGSREIRSVVRNVDPAESDLAALDGRQLAAELKGLDYVYHTYADLGGPARRIAGFDTSSYWLYLLLGMLVVEQVLSYLASYHPSRSEVRG
ncbi:MAG: BatA domain-containing protein [Pirellulales bacterium]